MTTSEGWADTPDSPFAHYFIEDIKEPRGAWRALCFQAEAMQPTFDSHNPQCLQCLKIMTGSIGNWREYYLRTHSQLKSATQDQ